MRRLSFDVVQRIMIICALGLFVFLATATFCNGAFREEGGIYVFISSIVFFILFINIKQICRNIKETNYKWFLIGIWVIFIVLQMLFLINSRNLLRYDALNVYDEAVSFFYDGGISPDTKGGYFSRYTNNFPITILTFIFLKIGRIFHILEQDFQNGILYLQLINMIAVDISLFFGMLLVWDFFKDKSLCLCYMLFILVSPLSYVWLPFYYSNTISMPFYMAVLWLVCRCFFKIGHNTKGRISKKLIILLFIAGFLGCIGFAIRATVGITIIAIGFGGLSGVKKLRKEYIIGLAIVLLGVMMGIYTLRVLVDKYVKFDYSDSAFPIEHWIMMGADGDGLFNQRDEKFTACFVTAQDKKSADRSMLKQRVKELGAIGIVNHAFQKMILTFGDGTGDYTSELSISENYSGIYRYVYGDRNGVVVLYTQAIYLTSLFSSIISAVFLIRRKKFHPLCIVLINMLGAFLFYMIWEAGNIYSISFIPLFYVSFVGGIDFKMPVLKKSNSYIKIVLSLIMLEFIIGKFIWHLVVSAKENELIYQVNQYMFETDNYQPCVKGITLQQTFVSTGKFDCIAIQVRNPLGKLNDSVYEIVLETDTGKQCEAFQISSSELMDYEFLRLSLESTQDKGGYIIKIRKVKGSNDVIWLYYDTGNYDAYTQGELTGFPTNSIMDLSFKVYYGKESNNYFDWYAGIVDDAKK